MVCVAKTFEGSPKHSQRGPEPLSEQFATPAEYRPKVIKERGPRIVGRAHPRWEELNQRSSALRVYDFFCFNRSIKCFRIGLAASPQPRTRSPQPSSMGGTQSKKLSTSCLCLFLFQPLANMLS